MAEKKRPGWVVIAGVLGIIMACCGIYSGSSMMIVPKMFEFQKKIMPGMMDKMMKAMPGGKYNGKESAFPSAGFGEMYGEMMKAFSGGKTWFNTWCYISGASLMLISGFYLFSSIMLLQAKRIGVKLFYPAIALLCVYSVVNSVILISSGSFLGIAFIAGAASAIVFNLVLLFVVLLSDKKAFV
jgi:hypothetical protein